MGENQSGAGHQLTARMGKIAQHIADLVLGGEILPGQRLDEQDLARRFNVSRTPIREALREVAITGLIELKPKRGAFVVSVTPAQLEEMFGAMAELEAACARLAAMSMTPTERRRLGRLHESMGEFARSGLLREFVEANDQFHSLVYAGAHNETLRDIAAALRQRLALYRRGQFRSPGRLPRSHAEHDRVVKAILSGDPDTAHKAMLHHVGLVESSFETLIVEASSRKKLQNAL